MTQVSSSRRSLSLEIVHGRDAIDPALSALQPQILDALRSVLALAEPALLAGEFSRKQLQEKRDFCAQKLWSGALLMEPDPIPLKEIHRDSRWLLRSEYAWAGDEYGPAFDAGLVLLSALDFLAALLGPHDFLRIVETGALS